MEYFRSRFHPDKKTGRNTGKNQEGEGGNGYAECIRQNTSMGGGGGGGGRLTGTAVTGTNTTESPYVKIELV
jgi:hypothetical protein